MFAGHSALPRARSASVGTSTSVPLDPAPTLLRRSCSLSLTAAARVIAQGLSTFLRVRSIGRTTMTSIPQSGSAVTNLLRQICSARGMHTKCKCDDKETCYSTPPTLGLGA